MQITFFYCVTKTILWEACIFSCDAIVISCDAIATMYNTSATSFDAGQLYYFIAFMVQVLLFHNHIIFLLWQQQIKEKQEKTRRQLSA